jgi:hypothetical protein
VNADEALYFRHWGRSVVGSEEEEERIEEGIGNRICV